MISENNYQLMNGRRTDVYLLNIEALHRVIKTVAHPFSEFTVNISCLEKIRLVSRLFSSSCPQP